MPSAPLPGQVAKFTSPLFMYNRIAKQSTAKHPVVYTAKDNAKTAFQVITEKPALAHYTLNRWYLKEKVHSSNRNRLEGLYECVLCASCTGACPQYWWNREQFLGPAVLLQSYRWLIEPLDREYDDRLRMFEHGPSVNFCHNIFNCSITCPKYLNPGFAAKEIKRMVSPVAPRLAEPLDVTNIASVKRR